MVLCGAVLAGVFGSSDAASSTAESDSIVHGSTNFESLPPPNFSPKNFNTDGSVPHLELNTWTGFLAIAQRGFVILVALPHSR
jgi:hypothetical protein